MQSDSPTPGGALVDAPNTDGLVRHAYRQIVAARLGNGCAQLGARALQRLRFTYDPDGKVVRALDLAQDGPGAVLPSPVSARRDFRYDVHGRLIEATGRVHQALLPHDYVPGTAGTIGGARHLSLDNGAALERYTQRFTYDVSGNLRRAQHAGTTASWSTDFWVADGSNRSLAALDPNGVPVLDPAAHFDATGNTVALAHLRSIAWSWRGCLTRAVTIARPGGVVDDERYAYGADRMRVRKVATRRVAGGSGGDQIETREVVYVGDQERVRVRRNGALVLERWTTHVGDGDRRVAVVDRHTIDTLGHEVDVIGSARVRYHLTTPQGSTSLELDEAGGLISYEEYLPHGGGAFIAGDDARDVARRDVRYAGKERDRATGLHAYPYRYYAPWLGRWLSCDPIGPKDDLNLYQFVQGDPIGKVDPRGTEGWTWSPSIPGGSTIQIEFLEPPRTADAVASRSPASSSPSTQKPWWFPDLGTAPAAAPPPVTAPDFVPGDPLASSQALPVVHPFASAFPKPATDDIGVWHDLPALSPPDTTLHFSEGYFNQQWGAGWDEIRNSDNAWHDRAILGALVVAETPLAAIEETARTVLNIPDAVINSGTSLGEHIARTVILLRMGERDAATVEGLSALRDAATGFNELASVAAPFVPGPRLAPPRPFGPEPAPSLGLAAADDLAVVPPQARVALADDAVTATGTAAATESSAATTVARTEATAAASATETAATRVAAEVGTAEPVKPGVISGTEYAKKKLAAARDPSARGEIEVAEILQSEGTNVHFQKAIGRRGTGTADLAVGGEANTGAGGIVVDVYTPTVSSVDKVIYHIAEKNNQAPNIIVNIRSNPHLSLEQFGTAEELLEKLRNIIAPDGGTMNIRSVRVIK